MQRDPSVLEKIKSAILMKIKPNKILLFGSIARCEDSEHSDYDLLIIIPDEIDKFQTAWSIYPLFNDLGVGVDLVFVHEGELETKRQDKNLIYHSALRDGVEIYAA